jgi:ribosomal protein S18 acetylase RimI-like enzyme
VTIAIHHATFSDLLEIAALAGALVRQHSAFDPKRFLLVENVESGYAWWFEKELSNTNALILAATLDSQIVGYAYGRVEERDWNSLLDAHGALHDVFVTPAARCKGIGRLLVERVVEELSARGVPRVVLHTAVQNLEAQKLFSALGFRQTMLEMTREASGSK